MCDCLIAFYSTGFPSEKAQQYVNLRRPYTLNNLEMGEVLHDRRMVSKKIFSIKQNAAMIVPR